MTLSPFKFPLNGFPEKIGALFAILQDSIHAAKRSIGESGRNLLEIDLFPTHKNRIYLISPIDKAIIGDIMYPSEQEMDMTHLTLGTAKITTRNGLWVVNWMNTGSFLVGEQLFGNINDALRFCRERALPVISCEA